MIETRNDLKKYLHTEKPLYIRTNKGHLKGIITKHENIYLWKLVKTIRTAEYYHNNKNKNIFYQFMNIVYSRKKLPSV